MSCGTNIIQLFYDILQDCQNGEEAAFCMCGPSAAFNTIPHHMLLTNLKTLGTVSGNSTVDQKLFGGKSHIVDINDSGVSGGTPVAHHFNNLICLEYMTCKISIYADNNNYKIRLWEDPEEKKMRINS